MPTASQPSRNTYNLKFVDFSFTERETINQWISTHHLDLTQFLTDVNDGGWKFTSSIDQRDDVYNLTLTPKVLPKGRKNAPVYLIKHSDITKLLQVGAYFWYERLNGGDSLDADVGHDHDW